MTFSSLFVLVRQKFLGGPLPHTTCVIFSIQIIISYTWGYFVTSSGSLATSSAELGWRARSSPQNPVSPFWKHPHTSMISNYVKRGLLSSPGEEAVQQRWCIFFIRPCTNNVLSLDALACFVAWEHTYILDSA